MASRKLSLADQKLLLFGYARNCIICFIPIVLVELCRKYYNEIIYWFINDLDTLKAMVKFGGATARVRSKHPALGAQPSGMDILFKRSQLRAHNGARLPQCEEIIVIMDLWSTALAERIYCVELTSLGTPTSGTNC